MGPYVCVAESLHYSPESITTLLIGCVCTCTCVCAHMHAWSCQALCNPMDGSPSGFSVHGIIQEEYWSGNTPIQSKVFFKLVEVGTSLVAQWLRLRLQGRGPGLVPGQGAGGASQWRNGEESTCQCRRRRKCGFDPWVVKIPWSRE